MGRVAKLILKIRPTVRKQPCRRTQRARWPGAGSPASDVRPAGAADPPEQTAGCTVTPKVAPGAGVLRRHPPCQRTPKVALGAGALRRHPFRQTVYQHQTDVLAAATDVEHSSAPLRAWKQKHQSTGEGRYFVRCRWHTTHTPTATPEATTPDRWRGTASLKTHNTPAARRALSPTLKAAPSTNTNRK